MIPKILVTDFSSLLTSRLAPRGPSLASHRPSPRFLAPRRPSWPLAVPPSPSPSFLTALGPSPALLAHHRPFWSQYPFRTRCARTSARSSAHHDCPGPGGRPPASRHPDRPGRSRRGPESSGRADPRRGGGLRGAPRGLDGPSRARPGRSRKFWPIRTEAMTSSGRFTNHESRLE